MLLFGLALSFFPASNHAHADTAACPGDCVSKAVGTGRLPFDVSVQDTGDPASPTLVVLHDVDGGPFVTPHLTAYLTRDFKVVNLHVSQQRPAATSRRQETASAAAIDHFLSARGVSSFMLASSYTQSAIALQLLRTTQKTVSAALFHGPLPTSSDLERTWKHPLHAYWSDDEPPSAYPEQIILNVHEGNWQLTVAMREDNSRAPSEDEVWHAQFLLAPPPDRAHLLASLLAPSGDTSRTDEWRTVFERKDMPLLFFWTAEAKESAPQQGVPPASEAALKPAVAAGKTAGRVHQDVRSFANRKLGAFMDFAAAR